MAKKQLKDIAVAMKKLASITVQQNAELAEAVEEELSDIRKAIQAVITEYVQNGVFIEGYIRIAGTSDPALFYRSYGTQSAEQESVFSVFHPCLVGNNLTGQVGSLLHTLKKLGARTATDEDEGFTPGQAVWDDLDGHPHAIDGSEGDVMVCNVKPYYQIAGHYDIAEFGGEMDVFLRSLSEFSFKGIIAERIDPQGESPDYTVAHNDGGTTVMHSVYNPGWAGSACTPEGVKGKYIFTTDEATGEIVETYDEDGLLSDGTGGRHTHTIALYTGEQYAMNMQGGAATVPYYNKTARAAELLWAGIVAEGGTFDAHRVGLMGSGFSANDGATAESYWAEDATGARNGVRYIGADGTYKYMGMGKFTGSSVSHESFGGCMVGYYCNPFKCMEAYRVLCYAVAKGIPELTWFTFEGGKYKWRSISGFAGPAQGEATAVVWRQWSARFNGNIHDPSDATVSLEGNRVDLLVSVALWHGVTTQVSPSWWTSGLVFTEDASGAYEAWMQRDQALLVKTPDGSIATSSKFSFEESYQHVGETIANGSGYRKNYTNDAMMVPDTNANKAGAGLHTYIGAYNYYTGSKASSGKKLVRGFRRGYVADYTNLSPLCVYANYAPSSPNANIAFGTCVRLVTEKEAEA